MTFRHDAYEGGKIAWVFTITDQEEKKDYLGNDGWNDRLPYHPEKCEILFDRLISDYQYGYGLGRTYCVVDGTGGDGLNTTR